MSIPDLSAEAMTPSELEIPYSSLEYRQHQMFPRLSSAEIQSLRRFAKPMSFKSGELIFETGHVALGLFVSVAWARADLFARQPSVARRSSRNMKTATSWRKWRNYPASPR